MDGDINRWAGVQEFLPGLKPKTRWYCLETALNCDNCRPLSGGLIESIKLTAVVIAVDDGDHTEISLQAKTNTRRSFQRRFYPLKANEGIRSLRFLVHFSESAYRSVTLYADRMVVRNSDRYALIFEDYLMAAGVLYEEE